MPMFYTPKPRQFHYTPRFYDPEKEKWEALKKKYSQANASETTDNTDTTGQTDTTDQDLAYFERRVSELDSQQRSQRSKLSVRDIFRRREMPTFNYQPRFGDGQPATGDSQQATAAGRRQIKIRRRFDIDDTNYMKPVSAGRIMLYALVACLLLYFILF